MSNQRPPERGATTIRRIHQYRCLSYILSVLCKPHLQVYMHHAYGVSEPSQQHNKSGDPVPAMNQHAGPSLMPTAPWHLTRAEQSAKTALLYFLLEYDCTLNMLFFRNTTFSFLLGCLEAAWRFSLGVLGKYLLIDKTRILGKCRDIIKLRQISQKRYNR